MTVLPSEAFITHSISESLPPADTDNLTNVAICQIKDFCIKKSLVKSNLQYTYMYRLVQVWSMNKVSMFFRTIVLDHPSSTCTLYTSLLLRHQTLYHSMSLLSSDGLVHVHIINGYFAKQMTCN